jgi:hypothetical protein
MPVDKANGNFYQLGCILGLYSNVLCLVGIPEPDSYSRIDGGHVLFTFMK